MAQAVLMRQPCLGRLTWPMITDHSDRFILGFGANRGRQTAGESGTVWGSLGSSNFEVSDQLSIKGCETSCTATVEDHGRDVSFRILIFPSAFENSSTHRKKNPYRICLFSGISGGTPVVSFPLHTKRFDLVLWFSLSLSIFNLHLFLSWCCSSLHIKVKFTINTLMTKANFPLPLLGVKLAVAIVTQ